ncbi:Outer mitochondrial membrane transport complex protein Glutathione S transferase N terminal domain [Trypanosoma vivax]|uniref:Thioredoxin-like fold domain-containing protein n=1 Tax=Trypanosoma vivax (strain Y486) TaxID=1055687 RepID=G0U1Q6_TRYVY|nr:hypothetical protein TRVL_05612 [Trypanosoma vivax]KAH8617041.1 Outer mitochondrial membrane transport complex protein Glutathione S transferase N terminal domain [Trypanosoma vivax]CCC50013.1 conserved hypothetical protein [Trypanosoma vivax Y486]
MVARTGTVTAVYMTFGVVSLITAYVKFSSSMRKRQRRAVEEMERDETDLVYLLIYPRWGLAPSLSPSCTCVETFLRLARIPYKVHITYNTSASPTGCLPCIIHKGKHVAEPSAIIRYLIKEFKVEMDASLNKKNRAVGMALGSMLEHETRFALYRTFTRDAAHYIIPYALCAVEASWPFFASILSRIKADFFCSSSLVRLNLTKEQHEEEYLQDLEAIEGVIGGKPFLFGSKPTSYDCAVYAALLPVITLRESRYISLPFAFAAQNQVLSGYVRRMSFVAFPDLDELLRAEGHTTGSTSRTC